VTLALLGRASYHVTLATEQFFGFSVGHSVTEALDPMFGACPCSRGWDMGRFSRCSWRVVGSAGGARGVRTSRSDALRSFGPCTLARDLRFGARRRPECPGSSRRLGCRHREWLGQGPLHRARVERGASCLLAEPGSCPRRVVLVGVVADGAWTRPTRSAHARARPGVLLVGPGFAAFSCREFLGKLPQVLVPTFLPFDALEPSRARLVRGVLVAGVGLALATSLVAWALWRAPVRASTRSRLALDPRRRLARRRHSLWARTPRNGIRVGKRSPRRYQLRVRQLRLVHAASLGARRTRPPRVGRSPHVVLKPPHWTVDGSAARDFDGLFDY
jgi:hypothetical protein